MLKKVIGRFSGWLSYSFTKSRRHFDSEKLKGVFPSSHERPHEFNAVITFKCNDKWNFGGTFVFASGTPFTGVKQFYMINNNLISEFGDYNSCRLDPYSRLDLSATYAIKKTKAVEYGVNLSLYNALYSKNPSLYRLKIYNRRYTYRNFGLFIRTLPSLDFYLKF